MDRPDSVFLGRDPELLQEMLNFYNPGPTPCHMRRKLHVKSTAIVINRQLTFCDIDAEVKPDIVCSWDKTPFANDSVDLIVFDPPHLPKAAASTYSLVGVSGYKKEFGLALAPAGNNVSSTFPTFLQEAYRILKQEGLIFAKIKDYVHNHNYQWSLVDFINAVNSVVGLTACDLRIKRDPCGGI